MIYCSLLLLLLSTSSSPFKVEHMKRWANRMGRSLSMFEELTRACWAPPLPRAGLGLGPNPIMLDGCSWWPRILGNGIHVYIVYFIYISMSSRRDPGRTVNVWKSPRIFLLCPQHLEGKREIKWGQHGIVRWSLKLASAILGFGGHPTQCCILQLWQSEAFYIQMQRAVDKFIAHIVQQISSGKVPICSETCWMSHPECLTIVDHFWWLLISHSGLIEKFDSEKFWHRG